MNSQPNTLAPRVRHPGSNVGFVAVIFPILFLARPTLSQYSAANRIFLDLGSQSAPVAKIRSAHPQQTHSYVEWIAKARWIEDGKFFTFSGISAGMDMTLAVIAKLCGREKSLEIARRAEYEWHEDRSWDPFAAVAEV